MDERKQAIKKFVHDYSVAITTTLFLIVVLLILILARHNGLVSIKDLSKINPLITSEQNKLVASNDSAGIVKVSKDDEEQDDQDESKNTQEPGKSTSPTTKGGGTSGNGTGGGTSGGTGTGNTGSGPTQTPQPFSARIVDNSIRGSMNSQCSFIGLGGSCIGTYTYTYTLTASIAGSNGPGSVSYSWSAKPTNGSKVSSTGTIQADSGTSDNVISTHWSTNKCTSYDVTLTVTSPSNSQQNISTLYSPSC